MSSEEEAFALLAGKSGTMWKNELVLLAARELL